MVVLILGPSQGDVLSDLGTGKHEPTGDLALALMVLRTRDRERLVALRPVTCLPERKTFFAPKLFTVVCGEGSEALLAD
jgi:hypothetical protein